MIYQDVKRFLKQHLRTPTLDYSWSEKDTLALFKFLQKRYSDDAIDNNAMEIREAFRHFLEPIGNALVRYSSRTGISYKVFPYHLEPSKSKHLPTLISIIRENRRSIEFPYNGRHDQIAIKGKVRRAMNAEIIETDENINKRELTRHAIKEALGLGERDVVLHLKKKYLIKLFHENSFVSPAYETKTEFLDSIDDFKMHLDYEEFFKEHSMGDFLDNVMASAFSDELNFDTLSNAYYEANALSIIKKEMIRHLQEFMSHNEEYLKAFAKHILKEHVIDIHERMAIELFEKISKKSANARQFLSYYSGQVFVENGKRYMIPEIATEDGKRWNINSLISTSSVWLRSRSLLLQSKIDLANGEKKINALVPEYTQAKNDFDAIVDEIKELRTLSDVAEEELLSLSGKITLSKFVKKEAHLKAQIYEEKKRFKELQVKTNALLTQKVYKEKLFLLLQGRLLDQMREKKLLTQKINSLEKELAIGSDAFNSILSSVVKALMKRKSEID